MMNSHTQVKGVAAALAGRGSEVRKETTKDLHSVLGTDDLQACDTSCADHRFFPALTPLAYRPDVRTVEFPFEARRREERRHRAELVGRSQGIAWHLFGSRANLVRDDSNEDRIDGSSSVATSFTQQPVRQSEQNPSRHAKYGPSASTSWNATCKGNLPQGSEAHFPGTALSCNLGHSRGLKDGQNNYSAKRTSHATAVLSPPCLAFCSPYLSCGEMLHDITANTDVASCQDPLRMTVPASESDRSFQSRTEFIQETFEFAKWINSELFEEPIERSTCFSEVVPRQFHGSYPRIDSDQRIGQSLVCQSLLSNSIDGLVSLDNDCPPVPSKRGSDLDSILSTPVESLEDGQIMEVLVCMTHARQSHRTLKAVQDTWSTIHVSRSVSDGYCLSSDSHRKAKAISATTADMPWSRRYGLENAFQYETNRIQSFSESDGGFAESRRPVHSHSGRNTFVPAVASYSVSGSKSKTAYIFCELIDHFMQLISFPLRICHAHRTMFFATYIVTRRQRARIRRKTVTAVLHG